MTHPTHSITSALTFAFRITTMVLVALVLIVMLSSPARAQWTTNGNNISNTNTGNVGIGTSSPVTALHVATESIAVPRGVTNSQHSEDNNSALFTFRKSRGTIASPAAAMNGDNIGNLYAEGYDGTSYIGGGRIRFAIDGAVSSGVVPTTIQFLTGNNGSGTERMRVTSAGNVGIGTTTPGAKLDIGATGDMRLKTMALYRADGALIPNAISGDATSTFIDIGNSGNLNGVRLFTASGSESLRASGTISSYVQHFFLKSAANAAYGSGSQVVRDNSTGVQLELGVYSSPNKGYVQSYDGAGQPTHLLLNPLGSNIGIGTSGPNYRLDVQGGQVNSSGGLCIAGDCKTAWSQVGGSSQWTTTGSNIYYNSGTVGVGTASPAAGLDVQVPLTAVTAYGVRFQQTLTAGNNNAELDGLFINPSFIDGVAVNIKHNALVTGAGNVGIGTSVTNAGLDVQNIGIAASGATFGTRFQQVLPSAGNYATSTAVYINPNFSDGQAIGVRHNGLVVASGDVGIGTSAPAAKLDVNGNVSVTGNITATGNIAAKYQDVAEWVESSQLLPAGTVVVLDQTKSNQVVASSQAYDTRVAGVVSAQPGIMLGQKGDSKVLVATTGRVKVKVDASAGPIHIGDLLVTSDIEGVAKKSEPLNLGGVQIHRPGTLIGKALEPLAKGTGEILVLLSLQ